MVSFTIDLAQPKEALDDPSKLLKGFDSAAPEDGPSNSKVHAKPARPLIEASPSRRFGMIRDKWMKARAGTEMKLRVSSEDEDEEEDANSYLSVVWRAFAFLHPRALLELNDDWTNEEAEALFKCACLAPYITLEAVGMFLDESVVNILRSMVWGCRIWEVEWVLISLTFRTPVHNKDTWMRKVTSDLTIEEMMRRLRIARERKNSITVQIWWNDAQRESAYRQGHSPGVFRRVPISVLQKPPWMTKQPPARVNMAGILEEGVAIIGAGLGGTALALALHQQSIPCRLNEARSAGTDPQSSSITISANGLKILDQLGVLEQVSARCFKTEFQIIKNDKNETVQKIRVGSQDIYGYQVHRVYRSVLLSEMKAMLAERGITIIYDCKLTAIISDTPEGVRFEAVERAALVIGADGIHSTVRRQITDVLPEYNGVLRVYGHIPASSIDWPDVEDFNTTFTILGKPASLSVFPEDAEGAVPCVVRKFPYSKQDRTGWEELAADEKQFVALFLKDHDQWRGTARAIMEETARHPEILRLWPFYYVPKMSSWASPSGRFVLVGDAAHAMPPSSGQGFNQALEYVYTLARLLSAIDLKRNLPEAFQA
ncbi:hypothetical protein YB2330_003011 [Saitoella coloradoensis]